MKNLKFIFSIFLVGFVLLAGCSNKNGQTVNNSLSPETVENNAAYPISIEHAYGTTVIESKPERVVTISWSNQDVPLALNVAPVGVSRANFGKIEEDGLLPWTSAKFKELNVVPNVFNDLQGLDFEAISAAEPDVILASYSGITEEEYNLLSEIAPVVAFKTVAWQTYWREIIIEDSKGMGKAKEGEELVKELEALIEAKVAQYPEIKGKKAIFTYFDISDLSSFYVYLPSDPRANYLLDLGMEFPEEISKLNDDASSFAISLSAENIDVLNSADIIVTYGDANTLSVLQADELVGQVPAISNGAVVMLDNSSALAASATPSALSIPATIDDYLKAFSEAAKLSE